MPNQPDGSGFEQLSGKRAYAWRQRIGIVRERYVSGVRDLDERARAAHDADFVDLTPEQQDEVLRYLDRPHQEQQTEPEQARATLYGAPVEPAMQQTSAEVDLEFVPLLALHTQGFYADPVYSGNRNRIGWDVIGFPAPAFLAEVHTGRYSTLDYFAEREHPIAREPS